MQSWLGAAKEKASSLADGASDLARSVADKVDELVRERVRAGAAVKAKRWEKGRHVAHLYGENRKEYLALIEEFMRPSRMSCGLEFYLGEFSDVVFT